MDFIDMLHYAQVSYLQVVSNFSKFKLTMNIARKVSVGSGPAEKMRRRVNTKPVVMRDFFVGI